MRWSSCTNSHAVSLPANHAECWDRYAVCVSVCVSVCVHACLVAMTTPTFLVHVITFRVLFCLFCRIDILWLNVYWQRWYGYVVSVSLPFFYPPCSRSLGRMTFVCVYVCLSVCLFAVLFFSRPRSEAWPHHGRTFSIYRCLMPLVICNQGPKLRQRIHLLQLLILNEYAARYAVARHYLGLVDVNE